MKPNVKDRGIMADESVEDLCGYFVVLDVFVVFCGSSYNIGVFVFVEKFKTYVRVCKRVSVN